MRKSRTKGWASRRGLLASTLFLPWAASGGERMTTSEQAQWELLWEVKRFHYIERITQRVEIRRRYEELIEDERNCSLEARERLRGEIADISQTLRVLEAEVARLEKETAKIEQWLKLVPGR
jgi:hypothetical protein